MAEGSRSTVAIVPLNGTNYGTWKVQAKMGLLKEGLWGIVEGSETEPTGGTEAARAKFAGRRDKALATLGLSLEPTLLYLIDGIDDPKEVWKKITLYMSTIHAW